MKTAIYTMRRDNWTDYFEMHVSKTQKEMAAHVRAFYKKEKMPVPEKMNETLGLCSPVINTDGLFAYLFLSEEWLGAGIVAHECLHVSMAHERFINHFGMNYGPEIGDDEERLAYFLTDCIKGVYNTLRENGHIKE